MPPQTSTRWRPCTPSLLKHQHNGLNCNRYRVHCMPCRTCRDRAAATGGELRPRRHRRVVHGDRRIGTADGLRLRRTPRRGRLRRTRFHPGQILAAGHGRCDRVLANTRRAARHASSRRSAATATIPSTNTGRYKCCGWYWPNSIAHTEQTPSRPPTPSNGRLLSLQLEAELAAVKRPHQRPDNAIRRQVLIVRHG